MKMLQKSKNQRPREKLKQKGPRVLSDIELLQALIGSGNKQADVGKIASDVKKVLQQHGAESSYEQLAQVTGMGGAKITELLAAFELSKRYLLVAVKPIIDSPEKAVEQLADIRNKKQEYFVCLTLDGASRLIAKRTITIGTLNSSLVHPREVFADAITDRAASIIVAHNHPSGALQPSKADVEITKQLRESALLLGVNFNDHIIVTNSSFISVIDKTS